jgi:hypothetical protein
MAGDRIQQPLVQIPAEGGVTLAAQGDHGLERLERLQRALETDGPRLEPVPTGRLGHDRADQVVRQDVGPQFLPDQLRRLAPQHVHLEHLLERP